MRLNFTAIGHGAPVCLLHGLFGRLQNLAPVARRLAGSHRVLSLDLRNHGGSPHAAGMDYRRMAADVLETLRAEDALPAGMLGHSMGGKVAMLAALESPEAVTGLVVADIAPVAYRHHNAQVAAALLALQLSPDLTRRAADAALAPAIPDPGIRAFLMQNLAFGTAPGWKIGLAEIAAGMGDIEGWPALPQAMRYPGPCLFVRGGKSDYLAADALPSLRLRFPQARLAVIEAAGHWLHAEQPEQFGGLVAAFFSQAGADTKI